MVVGVVRRILYGMIIMMTVSNDNYNDEYNDSYNDDCDDDNELFVAEGNFVI